MPAAAVPTAGRWRRVALVATVAAALVAGALATRPAPSGTPLLGRLDLAGGRTSTAPPPAGLRVAWAHDVGEEQPADHWYGPTSRPVVRDGHVLVDGMIVELATGVQVADVRTEPLWGSSGEDGEVTMLRGDRLVVADVLTGEVLATTDVPDDLLRGVGLEGVAVARVDGVSLFSTWPTDGAGPGGWLLLRDDGTVVARGDGYPENWNSLRAPGSPYVVVTEFASVPSSVDGGSVFHDGMGPGATVVLEAATGRTALRLPVDEEPAAVDVAGTLALTMQWTSATDGPVGATTTVWDASLIDLDTGRTLSTLGIASADRPVLLGTGPDGAALVGVRASDRVSVLSVDGSSEPRPLVSVGVDLRRVGEHGGPAIADAVLGVVADGVVALEQATGRVVAVGHDGVRRWARDVGPEADTLAVGDGHVAVTSGALGGRREVRLLRVEDGAVVMRTSSSVPPAWGGGGTVPLTVVDGVLAVSAVPARPPHDPAPLQHVDWFRLRDGREEALDDVIGDWVRAGLLGPEAEPTDPPPGDAGDGGGGGDAPDGEVDTGALFGEHLLGTTVGRDGRARPLLGRVAPGGAVRLVGRDGEAVEMGAEAPIADYAWLVGATPERVVVGRERGGTGSEVVVADRVDGSLVARIPAVHGIQVVGEVVLVLPVGAAGSGGGLRVRAIDLATGDDRWTGSQDLPGWPVRADEEHLLVTGAGSVQLHRVADGGLAWERDLGTLLGAHAVLTPRLVVVQTHLGDVVALDRAGGVERWRATGAGLVTSIAAAGDDVLLGTSSGLVVHLDGSGREVQRIAVGTAPVTAVAPLGDTVVAVVGHRVLALRADGDGITDRDEVDLPDP